MTRGGTIYYQMVIQFRFTYLNHVVVALDSIRQHYKIKAALKATVHFRCVLDVRGPLLKFPGFGHVTSCLAHLFVLFFFCLAIAH